MANPQTEQGHVRIANELWNELLRRDFSKRQLKLILFIWRLSYGTGQKDCKIEKFNLLELAGMYKQDVRKELKFLRDCAVLDWDEETMIFSINKNYQLWQITPNKNWDNEKFTDLIHQNLARKKVSKILTVEDIPKPELVSKILTYKSELVSKILTMKLVKYLPTHGSNAVTIRDSSSLKTLLYTLKIKDIKRNNNNDNDSRQEVSKTLTNPFTYYELNFEPIIPPAIIAKINDWLDDGMSKEMVVLAMDKTMEQAEHKRNWNYINKILVNWHKKGIKTPEQAQREDEKFYSKVSSYYNHKNAYQPKSKEVVPEWFANRNKQSNKLPNQPEATEEEMAAILAKYKSKTAGGS